jgi:hypothetical protein
VRIWTLDEIFRRWPNLWFRIAFETALPTLTAVVWFVKNFIASTGTLFGALTAAGLAFTAALYVQGQVLRMAKNVRDERDADEFRNSFESIRQAIAELNRKPTSSSVEEGYVVAREIDHSLLKETRAALKPEKRFDGDEANRALDTGLYQSAAVMSGIEFERFIRETAERLGIERSLTLIRVVGLLAHILGDKELTNELRTLVRLRNTIVHESSGMDISEKDARQITSRFNRAIGQIQRIIDKKV